MGWTWQACGGGNGGGGAPARLPALQSEIVPAEGMWALNGPDVTTMASDRSGNARNMDVISGPFNEPDLIRGNTAFRAWEQAQPTQTGVRPEGMIKAATPAALQIIGDLTVTMRIAQTAYPQAPAAPYYQYIVACGGDAPKPAGNVAYALVTSAVNNRLVYYSESGAGVGVTFESTLTIRDGLWHFVSLRRNAATGVVTIGVDGVYQSSGAITNPTGATAARLAFGRPPYSGPFAGVDMGFQGLMADVCIWASRLTDAQLLSLNNEAMGL